ncbi:asl3094 [Nostoc sp. PCC 7120 = FACHB-418]|nr:asl3094 [Nostoc sp. PCC 7120 = FACHB-418]
MTQKKLFPVESFLLISRWVNLRPYLLVVGSGVVELILNFELIHIAGLRLDDGKLLIVISNDSH